MGLNRFSTTGTSEYTSQHVPLPFDTISKMGEQVKLEHDTADAAAAIAKTDIQGGLATQEHAKALNAKKNALLAEAQDRAEKTGNYGRLTQDVKQIASTVQNDPLYQGIQRDIAMTKLVNEQRMDPNHPYVVQNYADEKGNVKQLSPDQAFDESYYNVVTPGNTNKEYKPLFDQVKPIVSKIYEQPVTKTWIDEMGKEHTQTLQEGVEAEGLRRDRVKEMLKNYIKLDPSALNQQSRFYSNALSKKQKGVGLTEDEHLDEITNAFLGEYNTEKEIQKLGADKVTSPLKDASGRTKSGVTGDDDGIVNQYALLVDAKSTQVATPQLDYLGWAKGPDDVSGSHMITLDNTDGQGAIVNFAKVTPDNPQANNIVTYGNELNNLKKTTGIEDNDMFVEKLHNITPKTLYRVKNGKLELFNLDKHPGTKLTQEEFQDKGGDIMHMSDVSVPVDLMKENYLKSTDEFKLLADEAKENGVDINNPNFRANYLKTLGVKTMEEANSMGQMLNISGQYPFILKDGNNKVNVGDKAFLDGYIILTRDQINAEMAKQKTSGLLGKFGVGLESDKGMTINPASPLIDDWEEIYGTKGDGIGLIQPYGLTREKEGTGQEQFKIPIKKPIQVSQIVNQNYNNSFYTPTVASKKSEYFAESYNDMIGKNMIERRNKVYGQSYTENPRSFKNNITASISSNEKIDADTKEQLFKIVEDLKKDPNASKESWVNFRNSIDLQDPKVLVEQYNNHISGVNSQSSSGGKSQGGWSQTPATPLKK